MNPARYLRRGGLTTESSSTFSALGLSSCWRSVPWITAAHSIHKKGGNSLNLQLSRKTMMNQHSARGPTSGQPVQEDSCSDPVVNMLEVNMLDQGRATGECNRSTLSTETNGSVSLATQVLAERDPYLSTLKSALATYPLSHMDVAVVPSTPKHVGGAELSAAFEAIGLDHTFYQPVILLRL